MFSLTYTLRASFLRRGRRFRFSRSHMCEGFRDEDRDRKFTEVQVRFWYICLHSEYIVFCVCLAVCLTWVSYTVFCVIVDITCSRFYLSLCQPMGWPLGSWVPLEAEG